MYSPYKLQKRYVTAKKSSATLDAILGYVYRKKELLNRCGRYANSVIDGLCELGLLKEVQTKKDTFYFSTDKAKNFKAIDFAKEFLLAFHNSTERNDEKILVFDSELPNGNALVEVTEAIKKGMV